MIQSNDALIASRCAPLPDNWLEMDFVRLANNQFPSGFKPIYYKPRAEFFSTDDGDATSIYTIEGRQIFIGGPPNNTEGQTVRIDYYSEVPVFADDTPPGSTPSFRHCTAMLVDARGSARGRRRANCKRDEEFD